MIYDIILIDAKLTLYYFDNIFVCIFATITQTSVRVLRLNQQTALPN